MKIEALRSACKGTVTASGEAAFQEAIHGNLWNRLIPDRAPQVVVRAEDEQDIIAAIRFAREPVGDAVAAHQLRLHRDRRR